MRYAYIEPIVDTTIKVLDTIIQSDIVRGDLILYRNGEVDYDVAIFIRITGDTSGSIVVNMDTETALKICNAMTGDTFERLSPVVLDLMSEIANMIVGNAISTINDMGFEFHITAPVIASRNYIKRNVAGLEIFQVPLYTDYGEITVNTAMRMN
jgi:chemotaxis protein CheX